MSCGVTSAISGLDRCELILVSLWLLTLLAGGIVEYRKAALESSLRRRFGRLTALIIFLGGIAVLGLELLSSRQKIEDTNKMVAEIQRILGRFESVEAVLKVSVPADLPSTIGYRDWLENRTDCFIPGTRLIVSKCYPREPLHPYAVQVLGTLDLGLEFSKAPLPVKDYSVFNESLQGDLALRAFLELGKGLELEYAQDRRSFVLRALQVHYQVSEGRRTGKIMSTQDLYGARMFVTLQNRLAQIGLADNIQSSMTLDSLSLSFSGAPDLPLTLSRQKLNQQSDSKEFLFYVYDIPSAPGPV
jgi:hypothetical protein